jgi:hypothetical protein
MHLWKTLSDTSIGRALIAYFLDLPRWTLVNVVFALALTPAFLAALNSVSGWIGLLAFPVVPVSAGMINMAAREALEEAPRWHDTLDHPATYIAACMLWLVLVIVLALLLSDPPLIVFFSLCMIALAVMMVGVFALFIPALLKVKGMLVWRNTLVLTVHYPMVGLGLLALLVVGVWAVWISRGALVLLIPALWVMIAVFSVEDRINTMQSMTQRDQDGDASSS